VFDPDRWGLPAEAVAQLGEELHGFWEHYRPSLRTRTRDTSEYALTFWRGQLTMEDQRNFANIDRRVNGQDGQALQHFMSESPWSAAAVFQQIQRDLQAEPALRTGGLVVLDESPDVKAGPHSAGAARQHNGRVGKIELSQMATCLVFVHPETGTWVVVDGELFLPEAWFTRAATGLRAEVEVPPDRTFATKLELGQRMIERAQAHGLPFERVACDEFYGRSRELRAKWEALGLGYAAQVPADTLVYLQPPTVQVPRRKAKANGRPPTRWPVQSRQPPHTVYAVGRRTRTGWQHGQVRSTERGDLEADFAVLPVWTLTKDGAVRAEWLVIRRDPDGRVTYSLLNGAADTPAQMLIERSCWRFFAERTFQDAKSELGWDDFQARKYRAWEHEMALTAAATWFVAGVKLQWRREYPRDPALAQEFELEVLPALSTANVRDLMMAALPLPEMTPERARDLVVTHLVNRARSTSSRLKDQQKLHDSS
jgi:SRSO17 transposase